MQRVLPEPIKKCCAGGGIEDVGVGDIETELHLLSGLQVRGRGSAEGDKPVAELHLAVCCRADELDGFHRGGNRFRVVSGGRWGCDRNVFGTEAEQNFAAHIGAEPVGVGALSSIGNGRGQVVGFGAQNNR